MDEQEPVKLRDGEDWLSGRVGMCPKCEESVKWDAEEGQVRCATCVFVNTEATQAVTRFLLSERQDLIEGCSFYSQQFFEIGKALGMPDEDTVDGLPGPVIEFARALVTNVELLQKTIEGKDNKINSLEASVAEAREAAVAEKAKNGKLEAELKKARAKTPKESVAQEPVKEEAGATDHK